MNGDVNSAKSTPRDIPNPKLSVVSAARTAATNSTSNAVDDARIRMKAVMTARGCTSSRVKVVKKVTASQGFLFSYH